jgi:DsbC/DsbD-like thiol-disulfide interchange protein
MRAPRLKLMALLAPLFLGLATHASADGDWVREGAVRMRLLTGEAGGGSVNAGLEIALDPGWKTYWVSPGPLGLAPRLDWSASRNLQRVDVLWPAPHRFSDGDAQSAGYAGTVILPLTIRPEDAAQPVELALKLDIGVCSTQCVPVSTGLSLTLRPGQASDALAAARLNGFRGRVPAPARLNSAEPLAVLSVLPAGPGLLDVTLRSPADAREVDLFVEGGDEVSTGLPAPLRVDADGTRVFRLKMRPNAPAAPVSLVAVADGKAIAVPIALDGNPPAP